MLVLKLNHVSKKGPQEATVVVLQVHNQTSELQV